jgi:hypothetical protein
VGGEREVAFILTSIAADSCKGIPGNSSPRPSLKHVQEYVVSFMTSLVVFKLGKGVWDWGGRGKVLYSMRVEDGRTLGVYRMGAIRSGSVQFDTWCVTRVRVQRGLEGGWVGYYGTRRVISSLTLHYAHPLRVVQST